MVRPLTIAVCLCLWNAPGWSKPLLGAYLWDGSLNGDRTVEGVGRSVRFLLDHGFQAVRIAITPDNAKDFVGETCSDRPTQDCVLDRLLGLDVFADRRLKLLQFTLAPFEADNDAIGAGWDEGRLRQRVDEEFQKSISQIVSHDAASARQIVVSNWEIDNAIYCGSAYKYSSDPGFREKCDSRKKLPVSVETRHFYEWISDRDEIVARARRPHLYHAPEMNNVLLFELFCGGACSRAPRFFDVMRKRASCSYSSYDAVNSGEIWRAVSLLRHKCEKIIIGEIGVSTDDSAEKQALFNDALRKLMAMPDVEAVFFWSAFADARTRAAFFGLYDAKGDSLAIARLPQEIRDELQKSAAAR